QKSAQPAPSHDGPALGPMPPPPPPPPSEPSRRGGGGLLFGAMGLGVVGVLLVLLVVVAGAAVIGVGMMQGGSSSGEGPVEVPESTVRDLRVALTGLTAGTPVEVSVDGKRPDNLSNTTF